MDPMISDHVTIFVLTKTAGRNCFRPKRPFRTPGVSQQCKYYLQWKIIREQSFTILRHHKLPREAFLGKIVVGHKNSKVINSLSHERIMKTFSKILDKLGKRVCKKLYIKFCKYVSLFF